MAPEDAIIVKTQDWISNLNALAQARGALQDIYIMVTSSIAQNASPEVLELCESISRRLLESDCMSWKPPSWCVHKWESKLWDQYLHGQIPPCGDQQRHFSIPEGKCPRVIYLEE